MADHVIDENTGHVNAKERFTKLDSMRDQIIERGRQSADITIPAMLPPEGNDENSVLPQPYQSLGARGVNNLTSKLRLSLFPPGNPFFRFKMGRDALGILEGDEKLKGQIEKGLQNLENDAMDLLEQGNEGVTLHATIKQLVVVGNVLLHMPTDDNSRIFRLNNYVVVRDPSGNWHEIVAREVVHITTLDEAARPLAEMGGDGKKGDETVTVYTHVKRADNDKAEWYQEINEKLVPGSEGKSDLDECPYIPLRWSALENENYGRGHVEEYIGDLRSFEDISKSLVQWAMAASKVVFLDRPNSSTDIEAIQNAESGQFVEGNVEDIGVLAIEKFADFKVVKEQANDLMLRISHAFLLQSGTVRDAERVTKAEIQQMAQELEDVLGGVYTVLAAELQRAVVLRLIARLKKQGKFPKLPKGTIKPVIVTGFDALGRGHELNRLRGYFEDGINMMGPTFMDQFDPTAVADTLATHHNVPIDGLRKTQEQLDADASTTAMTQVVDKAAGPAAGAAAKGIADNINKT